MSIHLVGNAHLDPAWMWRWDEGFAAFASTCRSALDRIAETDEFIFTASSAACFDFIERTDPVLFEEIREAVRRRRWSLQGGWWVEPDCNLPSGESFIRQGLYGQSYFRSRFGVTCDTGYCIDSFGHNANLPALLRACGMQNYVFMRPEQAEMALRGALMNWRSASGDEVIAYRIPLHYSNFEIGVREKVKRLPSYPLYSKAHEWMLFFGVGNHGGGPTKEQIQDILAMKREGSDLIFSDPTAYFNSIRKSSPTLPMFSGEMYPHAIGAYSAHAQIKQLNRHAETSLVRSEIFSVLSELATDLKSDWDALRNAWEPVLLNQFHDTLGGVATHEVLSEVESSYQEAISVAARHEREALQRIAAAIDTSDAIESLVVFNPTNQSLRTAIEFEVWHPAASERGDILHAITLRDRNGVELPTQLIEPSGKIGGDRVRATALVDVPSLGWNTFEVVRQQETAAPNKLTVSERGLSNAKVAFSLDPDGPDTLQYLPAQVFSDSSDSWGHGITGFDSSIGEFKVVLTEVIEDGPLRARLRVTSSFGTSTLVEDFILYHNSSVIEQRVRLNWQEKGAVCKLRYGHAACETPCVWSIPYGVIERPTGPNEYPFGGWWFASDGQQGIGIIAPTKTSAHADENSIGLTVARSVQYAHHVPPHSPTPGETLRFLDQGEQEFVVYIVLGFADWKEARMPHRFSEISRGLVVLQQGGHQGRLPRKHYGFAIDGNAILETLKRPHVGSEQNSIIIRIIESYGFSDSVAIDVDPNQPPRTVEMNPWELSTVCLDATGAKKTSALEHEE